MKLILNQPFKLTLQSSILSLYLSDLDWQAIDMVAHALKIAMALINF